MDEMVRAELNKKPRGILAIGWALVASILVVGLAAQFIIMRRAMSIDAERKVLKERQEQAEEQLAATRQSIDLAVNTLAKYNPDVENLGKQKQDLLGQVSSMQEQIKTYEEKLTAQKSTMSQSVSEEEQAKKSKAVLEKSVSELTGQEQALIEQTAALDGKIAEKRKLLSELTVDANTLQQKTLALAQLEADLKKANQDAQEAKAELDVVEDQLADARTSLVTVTAQTQALVRKVGSADTLDEMLGAQRKELGDLTEKLDAKKGDQAKLRNLEADLDRAASNLKKLTGESESAEARLEELNRQLSERRKELATVEEKLETTRSLLNQTDITTDNTASSGDE